MILDTTFLVDVLRGEESVEAAVASIDESGVPRVSAAGVVELREGIRLADSSDAERTAVRDLLEGLHELPFDRACAITAGTMNARLRESGRRIETDDVRIAATARVRDLPAVTRNVEHFQRIPDVSILAYRASGGARTTQTPAASCSGRSETTSR